jgi:hypothetical protein
MVTVEQLCAARGLLGWSQSKLAARAAFASWMQDAANPLYSSSLLTGCAPSESICTTNNKTLTNDPFQC